MFNFIIFILGAMLMFYMALRSRAQRHKLCTKGQKVSARVAGLAQSRHGAAYVLEFETAGGSHRLHYPKAAKGKGFAEGETVTLYYDPDDLEKMYVEGDKAVLGAEVLYAVLGVVLLCSLAESCLAAADSPGVPRYVSVAGALAITLVAAGDFRRMMGLGVETMSQLEVFSKALLPTLSAAVAAGGGYITAGARQVATVFFTDLLIALSVRYCCRCCTPALLLPPRTPWFPATVCKRSVRAFASALPGH